MKRLVSLLLLAALALPLCGCGSIFNEEYVVVGDYTPALPAADAEDPQAGGSSLSRPPTPGRCARRTPCAPTASRTSPTI